MSKACREIHRLIHSLARERFPLNLSGIPKNGIYALFEEGEVGHNRDRIVRIGTHTGSNRLCLRLEEHFQNENKDRSIFRKNIGRALLNGRNDPFLEDWNRDLTSKKDRTQYSSEIDFGGQSQVEEEVSEYIRENFSFAVFEVQDKAERLRMVSRLISTINLCDECKPSDSWLGNSSPKAKIVSSGLWQVNKLGEQPYKMSDIEYLSKLIFRGQDI